MRIDAVTGPEVEVQPLVRQKAHSLGGPGERWLAELPDLIGALERQWSLAVGPSSMDQLGLPPTRQIETLCAMLRRAWRVPRAAGLTVDPAQEKALALGEMVARLWESLGRPCSERVVAQALTFAERRAAAFDLDRCVVVHGDPHPGNALRIVAPRAGAEAGFAFVDPDGSGASWSACLPASTCSGSGQRSSAAPSSTPRRCWPDACRPSPQLAYADGPLPRTGPQGSQGHTWRVPHN